MLPAIAEGGHICALTIAKDLVVDLAAPPPILKEVATAAPLLCVVAVALQQGGAVAGEVSMGKAVVIGHDALRLVVEKSNMAHYNPAFDHFYDEYDIGPPLLQKV